MSGWNNQWHGSDKNNAWYNNPWVILGFMAAMFWAFSSSASIWPILLILFVILPMMRSKGGSCFTGPWNTTEKRKHDEKAKNDHDTERLYVHIRDGERLQVVDPEEEARRR